MGFTPLHWIPKLSLCVFELLLFPGVTIIIWLKGIRVGFLDLPDKGKYYQCICNHCQWVALYHSLLTMEEVTGPTSVTDYLCVPFVVAVKTKLHSNVPLVMHYPDYGSSVLNFISIW